ncbi:phosphate ABC transporter permease subunit PstC [Nocardioides sp. BP30]|uniref:phosphate ABC transporter permease subunit PstC n=1 Tax=Nocardioides sp. BP30 TaxID=3036374 RepID=UPI0024691838|nr:phosphate ABC transporter permease subunit PstC [Nocardioides sp. BP30]WGL53322.1 phosphate ABC transporter permease subunit PstC [Nocardioides sp. BP30]
MTSLPLNDATGAVVVDQPRKLRQTRETPDKIFRGVTTGSGVIVLAIMTFVGLFLAIRATQALKKAGFSFLTTQSWDTNNFNFGIAAVLTGTILIALVAICVAVPLSTATALYITEYAPARMRKVFISVIDLMAAIPSVVYGLWGFFFLQAKVAPVSAWIAQHFGWIPIFSVKGVNSDTPISSYTLFTSSTLIAGLVVGMMITPVVTSIMREVFSQVPVGEREGALGLGATKWGVIKSVVLPFGKGGMIGGTMLGLGRALGETIAVYMIISPVFTIQPHILQSGAISVSSLIALQFQEANHFGLSALMAAGLALFLMTLVINFCASSVVARSRSGASS